MKKIIPILMLILFSTTANSQNSYQNLWEKVEKFEIDNLPKSALKVVNEIYTKAEKSNNSPQIIKCLFYKSKFSQVLEEDSQLKIINQFKEHIAKSTFPTKNVLENILANLYWQYFNQNRWKFYNRTKTATKTNINDFRTWDLNTLFTEIHSQFQTSLNDKKSLQKIDIKQFSDILHLAKDSEKYRPTLYDFLANNALDFYKTDETNITKPAYQFKIDNENLLSNAEKFSTLKLASKDSLSLQFNALKIYQDLITFHLKSKNLKALADVDLQRLNFVKQHATFSNKTEYFLESLKTTQQHYKNNEISGLYAYEIAKIYTEQANYKNEKLRFKNKEALAICNDINKRFPKSNGAKQCNALKQQILSKSLTITVEKFTPIQQFQRVLVNYKNVDELYFSVYQITENQLQKLHKFHKEEEKSDFINSLSKVKNWSAKLKNEHDYLQHTTEVIVPKLVQGSYLLVASTDEKLTEKSAFGFDDIQITNLAFVQNSVNGTSVYQVLNRNTGKPIANAKVNLHNKPHTNNRYYKKLDKHFTTDKNGEFTFNSNQYYGSVKADVSYKNDNGVFDGIYINRYHKPLKNNTKQNEIVIFTDRSIYRPNQTVYFKGILFEKINKSSKILTNKKVSISLKDVNYQEVKKLEVTTNNFGSFSGEFILPSAVLTGNFSIVATFENRDFSDFINVEEYKRPKFETDFKPITKSYKLNDEIEITGFAKAFSGVKISDAKVVYRVYRKVQYPSWWYWYRPNFHSSPQEIKYGELTTDENGNFTIKFDALPNESVNKNNNPVFTYEVTADVTDINGETRSAKTEVKVGYHSLIATIFVDKILNTSERNHAIKIDTKNLNGEFVSANGTVKIYKLIPPKNILRKRPWNAPDYQEISEQEFREKFPNDAYKNEDNFINWKKGTLVFSEDFNTKKSKETLLKSLKKWQSGKYIIELKTQDRYGQKINEKSYFSVMNTKDKIPADNQLFSITTDKESYQIGDVAKITFSTNSKDVTVMLFIEKQREVIESKYIHLNKNSKTISVPVSKNDEGGFGISYYFINYNSFVSGGKTIAVPYPKTDLEIITKTFRNKLQPGENQTWSFTIKGAKKDKAFAEVLASMYDVSLDEFIPHNWKFNPIYKPVYNAYNNANARNSFQNSYLNFRNLNNNFNYYGISPTNYNKLNWFGFSFNGNRRVSQQYLRNLTIQRTKFEGAVSGVVEDETGVLPGVSISVKGTKFGTETDFDGKFNIKVNKGDILVFSFVGMEDVERMVGEFGQMFVVMENNSVLEEVVVVSYGKAKNYSPQKMKAKGISGRTEITMSTPPPPLSSPKSNDVARDYAPAEQKEKQTSLKGIQIRKNLQETAFFYPHLTTDKNGSISFNFTIPEALTKWKLQLLAHTKELHSATETLETVTQKELMVTPNAPRFLRQGDKITLSAKISNLSEKTQQGLAQLILTDAVTGKEINLFDNSTKNQSFSVNTDANTNVSWNLSVPNSVDAIQYKIVAKSGDFSDGEQNALPVLSNRILVTETLPMWVKSGEKRTFKSPLTPKGGTGNEAGSPPSEGSGEAFRLTLEVTSNPAWYAVQALPYLMEYPYECSEQTFARYYANTLASFIANSNPRIQEVFNSWKNSDALLSNLEKNQELKSLIIQETPWLRDAQSETEQKKRIALLFDLNKMKNEQEKAIRKLQDIQMNNGGFPWFKGGRYPNAYITQYIASGFGHLKKLGVTKFDKSVEKIMAKAVHFMDEELADSYQKLLEQAERIKAKKGVKKYEEFLAQKHIHYFELQYLYMRSFYGDITIPKKTQKAINYYKNQAKTYWNDFNLYGKGLNSLVQFRSGNKLVANKILNSLKENSITSEELGMYWKSNTAGYYNYQAPIETQALLIEAFSEIENDTKTVDNLKIWLLKNKQVSQWKTTKATSEAVYALLLQGSDWLSVTDLVEVTLGDTKIDPAKIPDVKVEAGTGYFKTSFTGDEIKSKMGDVTIKSKGKNIAWGGLYWQYFEDLDKITSAETPLKLKKKLFKKVNSDTGKKLIEITDKSTLKVGDLLTVRIELRSDRDMEFIHMKDMRASGVEPINVLSKYKWQDGLGYYESTKDASTNFFFSRLPKGVYVFEYDVRVNNAGDFSNGITTIESMYAPEFKSHSEGVRLLVE